MTIKFEKGNRKVKEVIDVSDMTPKEMMEEIKRVTGKG